MAITALLVAFLHSQGPRGGDGPPGPPGQVAILASGGGTQPHGNMTFSEVIDLPQPAVLTVTSFSDLLAKGPPDPKGGTQLGSAAARLVIMVDETIVTQSEEVYLAATQINLLVSANSATLLEPGKHKLYVQIINVGWKDMNLTPLDFLVKYIALGATNSPTQH